jgi:hypothetical protein
VIEVKRSIRASASLKRLFCKPSPKLTIVTIAATPTTTPMPVNEVLSLACRKLRHASAMMSANFIFSLDGYSIHSRQAWMERKSRPCAH